MIVVTGGAGMIGSNLVMALNAEGRDDILVVDDLTDPDRSSTGAYCYHDAQLRFAIDDKKKYEFYIGVDNVFDSYQRVRDDSGATPIGFQRGYVDPVGRFFEIDFRKRF